MLQIKLLVGLCLLTTCILAENTNDVSETFEELTSEDSVNKIDSEAFTHDVRESDECESKAEERAEDPCAAPNGLGLKNLLQEVDKILPKKQIQKVIKSFAQDPEVIALRAYARKPETKRKLKAIKNSQQFKELKDYSCRVLHLNLETFHNIASNLINPSSNRAGNSERKGIKGLANALKAILPKQKLRDLFDKLMRTDNELVKAVTHLKSDEFHQLLLNVKQLPEYQELRQELVALAVPVDEMRNLLARALGWSNSVEVLF